MGTEIKAVDNSELAQHQDAQAPRGIAPIVHLIASGQMSTEQVEKMMELQERWEANEARKAYNKAMTRFRENLRPAHKSGKNAHLRTTYATFDDIVQAVSGPLGDAGFSYSFKQEQSERQAVTVTCTITHSGGHSESTQLTTTIEGNKGINNLQALGLSVSYLKRYTLSALTGVATEDSDGQPPAPAVEMCSDADFADIRAACESAGKDYSQWLTWKGQSIATIDGVLQLPKAQKNAAIAQITRGAK